MNRRAVLVAAAVASSTALAGCTGGSDDSNGGDADGDDDTDQATTTTPDDGPPSIIDRSFTRTGDADTQSESARVAFGDGSVTCTGVIEGRNGCMEATLDAAEYDSAADELLVRVGTVAEGGDTCTQQIVYRGYEAIVEFTGSLPGTVIVEHASMGETRTIAEESR